MHLSASNCGLKILPDGSVSLVLSKQTVQQCDTFPDAHRSLSWEAQGVSSFFVEGAFFLLALKGEQNERRSASLGVPLSCWSLAGNECMPPTNHEKPVVSFEPIPGINPTTRKVIPYGAPSFETSPVCFIASGSFAC